MQRHRATLTQTAFHCTHSRRLPLQCSILAMVLIQVSLHPRSLHPSEAARAHYMRFEELATWEHIADEVVNLQGKSPSLKAVRSAVARVQNLKKGVIPQLRYKNCGRHKVLTKEQERQAAEFVKKWRHKRFCTCRFIIQEMKLKVSKRTLARSLNRSGFFWRPVPKKVMFSEKDLERREAFCRKYGMHSSDWWEANVALVLDGVTLTKAPTALSDKKKHAAQRIDHMWMRKGEAMDRDVHTYNRYGVQLGTKVPLWGGFSGTGQFSLRMWTPAPKMTKDEWAARVPSLKRAVDDAAFVPPRGRAKIWQDNERFLQTTEEYKAHGLEIVNFPSSSGDLNPIETVWARLRKDLSAREQEDLTQDKTLTDSQFRARTSQLLQSYSLVKKGETYNYYQKLLRGMPKRLAKCKANTFGHCGK